MAEFKPQSVPDPLPQPGGKPGNEVNSPLSFDLQQTGSMEPENESR